MQGSKDTPATHGSHSWGTQGCITQVVFLEFPEGIIHIPKHRKWPDNDMSHEGGKAAGLLAVHYCDRGPRPPKAPVPATVLHGRPGSWAPSAASLLLRSVRDCWLLPRASPSPRDTQCSEVVSRLATTASGTFQKHFIDSQTWTGRNSQQTATRVCQLVPATLPCGEHKRRSRKPSRPRRSFQKLPALRKS